ncbi:MAG: SDR family NAD(P)-dependent oxidoreductase, partial [Pseudonocardia sp.]|nr:SDR family NAD(P)-dependent oxidoreductase [Pseudonocardia sp.]
MTGRLAGKCVVVSGAGSVGPGWGNGRATAVMFSGEGARVLAADLEPESLEETLAKAAEVGGDVTPYTVDATDSDQVRTMLHAA